MKLNAQLKKTKCLIWSFALVPYLFIGTVQAESSKEQDYIENTWVVNYISDNTVHATVNGQITHGDRLHIRMVKGHCELGNLITFVYTYSNHPKIEQIGEKPTSKRVS